MDATQPQNDRELLLKLNSNVETLARSIDGFGNTLKELEEKKIGALESRIETIENKWTQVSGGWKIVLVIWTILTTIGIAGLIKALTK